MKVGDLATSQVITVAPQESLREAACTMTAHLAGSAVVTWDGRLAGIITERDILRAVAAGEDLDGARVAAWMTKDVVTVRPDWEVYEATAEMAARHIRHLVVTDDDSILGVLSVRDVLLAGQRVNLTRGNWAVLRDPLTFTIRERRQLQRYLLALRDKPPSPSEPGPDLDGVTALLVETWSFPMRPSAGVEAVRSLPAADCDLLRGAVIAELPDLQRAVHPSPGWRRRR